MITLATLPEATEQQVFDQVVNHAFSMEERSGYYEAFPFDNRFSCKYRQGENKCFAGVFISDEEYSSDMEDMNWSRLMGFNRVPKEHSSLIMALQEIHDSCPKCDKCEMHKYFDQNFIEFASEYGLDYISRF